MIRRMVKTMALQQMVPTAAGADQRGLAGKRVTAPDARGADGTHLLGELPADVRSYEHEPTSTFSSVCQPLLKLRLGFLQTLRYTVIA